MNLEDDNHFAAQKILIRCVLNLDNYYYFCNIIW